MNATQLQIRASRLLARHNAMGFTKNGKPMVIDQAFELVAAEEGHRNQHVLRAMLDDPKAAAAAESVGRQQWHAACNRMGWNEESQIVHLEGFLAEKGLLAEFGAYAQAAAEEEDSFGGADEPSEETVVALQSVGYRVVDSDFKQPYWAFGDEGSTDFACDEEAWADAWDDAQSRTVDKLGIARGTWDAMPEEARIGVVVKTLGKSPEELMRETADRAFEDYDFGEHLTVVGTNGWEWTSSSPIVVRTVFLQDDRTPEAESARYRFMVEVVDGEVVATRLTR
ncbi:hypothetical protein [Burkholderia ubonensis]|uniref:hypothetical protein n=1 Tax=Burkholderia ubonensis TaxID=101571 RepID=UPI00076C2485|nr:hypothetical protein [Burkholderia ubonensis]KVP17276.1 hypothetical protein WJ84_03320 [Burkholderia ubonensis]